MDELFKQHLNYCKNFMNEKKLIPLAHGLSYKKIDVKKEKKFEEEHDLFVESLKLTCNFFDRNLQSERTFGIPLSKNTAFSNIFTVFPFYTN